MQLQATPTPGFLACSTKRFQKDERHITRLSRYSVLILMQEGILRFREDGVDVELFPGEYYIQREGLLQEGVSPSEGAVYFYVEFHGSFAEGETGIPLRGKWEKDTVLPLTERLKQRSRGRDGDLFRINGEMLRIFSELYGASPQYDESAEVARRLKGLLDAEYFKDLSMEKLSTGFGYTKDHLIRIFKRHFDITPHQYLIRVRMDHARWLLENTSLTLEEVAANVGYGDFSAFYRAFRGVYGISPGAVLRKN